VPTADARPVRLDDFFPPDGQTDRAGDRPGSARWTNSRGRPARDPPSSARWTIFYCARQES
jgi:hypothetical protein